eukprot:scaffold9836_cov97-Isochrysis_galbana.AAC.4
MSEEPPCTCASGLPGDDYPDRPLPGGAVRRPVHSPTAPPRSSRVGRNGTRLPSPPPPPHAALPCRYPPSRILLAPPASHLRAVQFPQSPRGAVGTLGRCRSPAGSPVKNK